MTEKLIKEPGRMVPVIEADVLVVGGGTAGCIAAIAAARLGSNVVLKEKNPVPGGTLTNGGIGWNGYFAVDERPEDARRIVGGIAYELAKRLEEAGGATGFLPQENDHYHIPYRFVGDHEVFKGIVSQMLLEAGVKTYLQTMFCGVKTVEGRIEAAFIENKDGRSAVVAKQYVDCAGDGDVARAVGLEQLENWQTYDTVCGGPTGLVFGMAGIDVGRFIAENPEAAFSRGAQETADGTLVRKMTFSHKRHPEKYPLLNQLDINFFTNFQFCHEGDATYINNSKGIKCDASTADGLSQAELAMRIKIMQMGQAFKEEVPGFENANISWAFTLLGIRASKVTVCDKMLTQQEITEATRFEDEIELGRAHV